MTTNELFVRDLGLVTLLCGVIVSVAISLAPRAKPEVRAREVTSVDRSRPSAALGAKLYERLGCVTCHTVDGTPRVGPTFLHDYGSVVSLERGGSVAMDDAYIRESLLSPQAKSRPGYPPSMPSFDGIVKEREIQSIQLYLASLR